MDSKKIKILAIDDNKDNLITLKALIKESFPKALISTALSGAKGFELAESEGPDVILLDIVMPGMDGFEVCKKLKADIKLADIPVVFVTALKGDKESRIRALECGAESFLAKPIDESELTAQIKAMVKIRTANIYKHNETERLEELVEEQTRELKITHRATLNLLEDLKKENEARKLTEREMKKSQDRFINVANKVPGHIAYVNANTLQYEFVNDMFEISFGIPREKIIGSHVKDIMGKANYQSAIKHINEVKLGKSVSYENTMDFVSGKRWIHVNYSPVFDANGKVETIVVLSYDITDQRQAEEKLRQSSVFNESLLKTIPFGMDIVDETGTVLFQSDNFREVFGESVIGKKCWVLYRDDKKQCSDCPLKKGFTIGETGAYESHGVLGSRIFEISHTGMMYQDKKAMLEIFQDITERKEYEGNLIKAKEKAEESDRLKSAFLANMSHEIRTPMNGILGFTELLKEPNLSTDDQQDFIQTIQISGERMLNTINNIVDVSKIESGLINVAIDETNINKKIEFTYKFFKPEVERKGLQFTVKNGLLTKDAVIRTDNEKVYGVLTNLIKNAIKFTYDGLIEFGYVLKSDSVPAELEFYVKDTGVGIPKNQQQIVFERFRQGSYDLSRLYEGSGLGLSISKSYVEMLGGKIWVESVEGSGSTFYFTIPYNPVEVEKAEINGVDSTEIKEVQMKNLKILIVEDDEVSYSLLKRTIQKIGKEVLHAITGVEAIEACRNNPDLDLVLMDVKMHNMDGYEATRQIRQFNKDVVIIAQTAFAFSGDRETAIEAGCNDYITKPINMTLLFELIKKHVIK